MHDLVEEHTSGSLKACSSFPSLLSISRNVESNVLTRYESFALAPTTVVTESASASARCPSPPSCHILTSNDVHIHTSHPQIVAPNPPIHTAHQYFRSLHVQSRNTILGLRERHQRLLRSRFCIPEFDRAIVASTHDYALSLAGPRASVNPSGMSTPSPQRLRSRDIPDKDCLVTTYAYKFVICVRDRDVQNFVAVCGVGLDELRGRGTEEANRTIGAAGEELV